MTPWLIWLIVIILLAFVAFLKIGVRMTYHESFVIQLTVGAFTFSFSEKKASDIGMSAPGAGKRKKEKPDRKYWLRAVLENMSELLSLIGRILTAPTLDILSVLIEVGAKEPDECALKYGRICSLAAVLLTGIENTFVIKKRTVDIRCCFDKTDVNIEADVKITLRVYEIIVLAAAVLKSITGLRRAEKLSKKVV